MTECMHSAIWNPEAFADDAKDVDVDIPVHQMSVVPGGENQTCFPIAKMVFQHLNGLGVYVHFSEAGVGLGSDFEMLPSTPPDVNNSPFEIQILHSQPEELPGTHPGSPGQLKHDFVLAPGCIDDSLHLFDGEPPLLLHRVLG